MDGWIMRRYYITPTIEQVKVKQFLNKCRPTNQELHREKLSSFTCIAITSMPVAKQSS